MFSSRRSLIPALALVLAAPAARAGEPEMMPLPHRGTVLACAVSPDGKQVATGGADKVVRVFDLATGREATRIAVGKKVSGLAFSPDGKRLVTGDSNGIVQTWDVNTGKTVWKIDLGRGAVNGVAVSADGRRVVASDDQTFGWIDAPTGKLLMRANYSNSSVTGLALAPDGKTLATATSDKQIGLWDVQIGRSLLHIAADDKSVAGVAFSPDGKMLASSGTDKTVRLWDTATGKELKKIEAVAGVRHLAFNPDGKTLATAADKTVRLYDPGSGKETRRFGDAVGKINGLAFSPDGSRIVTVGDAGAVVWDLTHDEKPLPKDLKLSAKELDALWTDLAGADGRKAYTALRTLRAAPADSVPFLRERLKPKPADSDDKKIAKLIADLDDDSFDTREKATKDLEDLGRAAEAAVRKALAGRPSAEAKVRLEKLLAKLGGDAALTPEQNRDVLAVRVLELAGTPEARKLLESLVRESPGWWVTQEANAALGRLGQEK